MKYRKTHKKQFLQLLERHNLNVSKAVEAFRNTYPTYERGTFYNWLEADPWFKTRWSELTEREIDDAEQLHKLHRNGIPVRDSDGKITGWTLRPSREAVEFFLKTKGKHRGWIPAQENFNHDNVQPEDILGFTVLTAEDDTQIQTT